MNSLTERAWAGITRTYDTILAHPFLAGLTDGSLDPAAFGYYVVQDSIYLGAYSRALAALGATPDIRAVAMFAEHAAGAIAVERALHDTLLAEPV